SSRGTHGRPDRRAAADAEALPRRPRRAVLLPEASRRRHARAARTHRDRRVEGQRHVSVRARRAGSGLAAPDGGARDPLVGCARDHSERWTTHLVKAKRRGRHFIDTLRNGRGATWVAPWSPRARPGAPVSCPIAWEELTRSFDPATLNVRTAAKRLARRDPWG